METGRSSGYPDGVAVAARDVELPIAPPPSTAYIIRFKRLHPDAVLPAKGSPLSAGYDLSTVEEVSIAPGEIKKIPLGFSTELHPHIHARIESRSGLALSGMAVVTGVIDADYRGEWCVIMVNLAKCTQCLGKGTRVAQCVLRPTVQGSWTPVEELSDTQRGAGGFGSTGS